MARELIFTHFTNTEGVEGITGLDVNSLVVGETVEINRIQFGEGRNPHLASSPGMNFVTDLAPDVSALRLSLTGIFTEKQQFGISFSAETLHNNGIKYICENPERGIYTIPANAVVVGPIQVIRRF